SFALLWGGILVAASVHAALSGSRSYARFLQAVPVVGSTVRTGSLARFARAFSSLHGAGVPYDEALRIAAEASGNAVIRTDAAVAVHALARGATLPEALTTMSFLPSDDRGLLIAGEQSGELESAAERVATLEDQRFDVVMKRATALLPGFLVL